MIQQVRKADVSDPTLEEYCIFGVAPPKADFTLGRLEAAAPSDFATLEPILMRDTLSNGTGPAARAANTVKRIAFAGMLRLNYQNPAMLYQSSYIQLSS